MLNTILSGGKSSRLYDSLVYEQQVAADVYSDASLPQQPGMVAISAILASGKTVARGREGPAGPGRPPARGARRPPPSFPRPRTSWSSGKLRERETIDGRAFALGYALRTAGDAAEANKELAELQAVTAADVQRVARKYFTDEQPA